MAQLDAEKKLILWKTAISLQAVDGLRTSEKLLSLAKRNISGELSDEEVLDMIEEFGEENDIAAARTFYLIAKNRWTLEPDTLTDIHKFIFKGLDENAGKFRKTNMSKKEIALSGLALVYPNYKRIRVQLRNLFKKETEFSFDGLDSKKTVRHFAAFTAGLWKTHAFSYGNTRAVAVFFIEYLARRGFPLSNDVFAKNPLYFRNALARAVFSDKERGVKTTARFLQKFIKALLFNPKAKLVEAETRLDTALLAKKPVPKKPLDPEGVVIKVPGKQNAPQKKQPAAAPKKTAAPKKAAAEKAGLKKKPEPGKKSPVKKPLAKKTAAESGAGLLADGVMIKALPAKQKAAAKKPEPKTVKAAAPKKAAPKTAKAAPKKKPAQKTAKPAPKKAAKASAKAAAKSRTAAKSVKAAPKKKPAPSKKSRAPSPAADEGAKKILSFLKKHGQITNKEARECAGLSTESARRLLTDLCKKGVVRPRGKNKSRIYILA